ncbi:acetate--CoA ligase family protein [Streptacidiphilus rugosus]|uniref:acetate--CoA ligase family protein n=1 Tax=Streptacidiphilus rugosus TaxID=405783 RepID=UPI00055DE442|nr:acetate--CoA ligase [Streptacidiphilus rugosus]
MPPAPPPPPPARDLSALFDPRSVAIVGASADPAKWGYAVARQALRGSGRRPVHLVNRRGGEILGQPVATSLREIGGGVDLAVLSVPAGGFAQAVDEALDCGARALVAITAGLGELGPQGEAIQQAAVARVRAAGAVLVGPNCLGLADNSTELHLSSDPFRDGGVALLSQSGNVGLELQLRLARSGHGFSRFVSLGNQADLTLVELVRDCARHPETKVVAVYAEDFRDGRAFAAAAAEAASLGKPVVLLAPGGSDAAMRSALSHTGSMTSPTAVIDAVCRDSGIHRVHSLREFATVLGALHAPSRGGPLRRVAVLTDGGGHGTIAADTLDAAGFTVPALEPATRKAVTAALWENSPADNPVDLAGLGEQDPLCYARGVGALLAADEIDAVLLTGYFGGYSASAEGLGDAGDAERAAARALAGTAAASGKPVVVQSMYPDAPSCRILAEAGLPVHAATEDAVRALLALAAASAGGGAAPAPLPAPAAPVTEAGYLADRALLAAAGLPFTAALAATDTAQVADAAAQLRPPYVLKATGLLHKSDAGGVALGLLDRDALLAAHAAMDERLHAPAYSVEEMAELRDGVELIVGARWDPRFGPVLLVGLGGVLTEVLRDVVFALAPVTPDAARALLDRLRGAPLLHGVRGRSGVDLDAAARAIATVSELAAAHPEIGEIEVNPLLLTPTGALALDARVVLTTPAQPHS